jgi:hypothetical protein
MIFIKDQDRRELNILQPSTREVIRESVGNGPKGWAYSSVLPCYTEEYKVIQGIRCRRVALKDVETRADVGDTWISDEYFLVMIDTGKAAEVLHDWRVVEIDLGEPAAELFVAPRDYSVVQRGRSNESSPAVTNPRRRTPHRSCVVATIPKMWFSAYLAPELTALARDLPNMWRSRPLPEFIVAPNAIYGREPRFSLGTPTNVPFRYCNLAIAA